jgi:hypothetical protein
MKEKNEAAMERARALGYPASDLSEVELHDLWLKLKASKPAVYGAIILPNMGDDGDEENWYSAVTTFLVEKFRKDRSLSAQYYSDMTTDMWCFVDLYKNTCVWGGDF